MKKEKRDKLKEQKEMLKLYLKGWTYIRIAKKYNITRGTVKKRIYGKYPPIYKKRNVL